jgi:uncharacterized protein with PIN domain
MDERFICDRNLGKLAKWLRILGYDTLFYRGNADRDFLRKADQEGRIALTRKRDLEHRQHAGRLVVIKADRADAQIGEILEVLALSPDPVRRMSRCLRCNSTLEEIAKEAVEGMIPLYVYENCVLFRRCSLCWGIFWPGTHPRHVEEYLRRRIPSRRP